MEKEAAETPEQRSLESRVEVMALVDASHRPRGARSHWEDTTAARVRRRAGAASTGSFELSATIASRDRGSIRRGRPAREELPRRSACDLLRHVAHGSELGSRWALHRSACTSAARSPWTRSRASGHRIVASHISAREPSCPAPTTRDACAGCGEAADAGLSRSRRSSGRALPSPSTQPFSRRGS